MKADPTPQERLLAAVRTESGLPSLNWARPPKPLTGGFWAQMWTVRFSENSIGLDGELVARVMPNPDVAARETIVQAHLADSGYPTPKVRLAAGPGTDLDQAWMIMNLAPGHTLLAGLSGPSTLLRLPQLARDLPDRLAGHAAALHCIDPGPISGPEDDTSTLLERLAAQATTIDRVDLVSNAKWLQAHRPGQGQRVICHGDLHPFNVLTHPEGDTVLDWSGSIIADPAYDLAFTRLLLSYPPLQAPPAMTPVLRAAGSRLGRRLIQTYNNVSSAPLNLNLLDWYTSIHILRILTEVATWHAQDEIGQHPGHPFLTISAATRSQLENSTGVKLITTS